VLGFRLGQLREQANVTQAELARRMGVSQPRISQLEQGDPNQLTVDTIRRYVAGLGAHLKIVVDFDDRDVTVSTVCAAAANNGRSCRVGRSAGVGRPFGRSVGGGLVGPWVGALALGR
jgi:transcriptional regulator with XRE-family HTH domain